MTIDMSKYRVGAKVDTVDGVMTIIRYDDMDNTYLIGESFGCLWVQADGVLLGERDQFVLGLYDPDDTKVRTNGDIPDSTCEEVTINSHSDTSWLTDGDKVNVYSNEILTTPEPTSPVVKSEHDDLVKLFSVLPDHISAVIRICDSSGHDSLRGLEFSNGGGVSVHQLVVNPELISTPNKVFNRCDYQE